MKGEAVAVYPGVGISDSLPQGWQVVHLGDIFDQVVDVGHTDDLPVLAVTLDKGVVRRSSLGRRSEREVERHQYLRALPGDIAYNTMRMWQGGSGLVQEEGYLSPAYTVCRPRQGEDPFFWAHAFKSETMIRLFRAHSQGFAKDRYRLYFQHFASVTILRPPLSEQYKIAAILSAVDEFIEKTRVVIENLSILKEALTLQLLSKGVNSEPLVFQNLLGDSIPASWTVLRGEDIFSLGAGYGPSAVRFSANGDHLFLKVDDFNHPKNRTSIKTAHLRFNKTDNPGIRAYPQGSIVFPKRGAAILKNRVRILNCPAAIDPNIMALTTRPSLVSGFFAHQLVHIGLHNLSDNSGVPQINNKHLYPHYFAVPPVIEQQAISKILDAVDRRLESEEVLRVRVLEIKSALSAALLSGQIRVTPNEAIL